MPIVDIFDKQPVISKGALDAIYGDGNTDFVKMSLRTKIIKIESSNRTKRFVNFTGPRVTVTCNRGSM